MIHLVKLPFTQRILQMPLPQMMCLCEESKLSTGNSSPLLHRIETMSIGNLQMLVLGIKYLNCTFFDSRTGFKDSSFLFLERIRIRIQIQSCAKMSLRIEGTGKVNAMDFLSLAPNLSGIYLPEEGFSGLSPTILHSQSIDVCFQEDCD